MIATNVNPSLWKQKTEQISCLLNSKEKELHMKIMPVQIKAKGLFRLWVICTGICSNTVQWVMPQ